MHAKSLRRPALLAPVLALLLAFVCLEGSAYAQTVNDQSSSTDVAQRGPGRVPGTLQDEAARALVLIQNALQPQETPRRGFLADVVEFARAILIVVICLGGFMALIWIWSRCLRLVPRQGTLVSFEDLSVQRSDRPEKSRILTQSILDLLQNPRPVQMSDLQMDIMPGLNEPGFGNLQPAITMVSVSEYELSENPMKIGMVEFSMRDLLGLFSRVFTRPHTQYLEGWLTAEDGGFDAGARLLDRARKPVLRPRRQQQQGAPAAFLSERQPWQTQQLGEETDSTLEWRVRRVGDLARVEAVADLAAQILVDTGNSTLTDSWQSFRCFNKAVSLREDQEASKPRNDRGGSDLNAVARGHLERAVAYDPCNWIARFSLALTLSRDDEAEVALKHFTMLEKVVCKAWGLAATLKRDSPEYRKLRDERPTFCSVVDHLKDYPECAFLVLYNKAIALKNVNANPSAQSRDIGRLEQASKIFAQIARLDTDRTVELEPPYPSIAKYECLSERSRVELSLYSLSSLADLLADAEHLSTPAGVDGSGSRADQVETLLKTVVGMCERKQEEHWRSLQTARAVTLTAHASALEKERRWDEARDALLEALAAEPRFVKASLRLAELYMNGQASADSSTRARALLTRVLEIHPSCEHAMLLLKKLDADPSVDRAADAALLHSLGHTATRATAMSG